MKRHLLTAALLVCAATLQAQTRGDLARLDSLLSAAEPREVRELTLRKASMLKRMYRFDEAAEVLGNLLEPGRMDPEILGEIADNHYQAGNAEDASALYGILTQLQPDNIGFRVRYLTLAFRAKAYKDVVSDGRDILQRDTLLPVLTLVADAFQKLEQPDSALVYYRAALRKKPKNASVVSKVSDILLARKLYDEVLSLAESYLSMDPDNIPVGKVKGLALYLKKEYKPSSEAFEHVLAMGDDSYGSHYYLGRDFHELRLPKEADEHYLRAWQIDSSDVFLATAIGTNRSTGYYPDFERMVEPWFRKALEMMEPDQDKLAVIYQSYGEAAYLRNRWDDALPLYRKAAQYNPKNLSFLSTIGYIYEQKKDYKSALEWYERYLALGKPGTKAYRFVEESVRYLKAEKFMTQE